MVTLRKMGKIVINVFETYLPMISFLIMFIVFIIQIFFRYILQSPLSWTVEVTQIAYIWTIFLGACFVAKKKEHICFSIVYDLFSEKTRAILTIIASGLIVFFLLLSIPSTLEYFKFLTRRKTNVLFIRFHIAYFPYLVFLAMTCSYGVRDIFHAASTLRQIKNNPNIGGISK